VSPEDYLKTFMEMEVKPLWPKGWMQARYILFLELYLLSYVFLLVSFKLL